MTQFAVIAPTAYLEQLATRSTYHLALAHIVDKDPVYADFYHQRSVVGDYVVMDNGAFELKVPYDPERLVELGKRCGAKCIVLPDYPFEHHNKTIVGAADNIHRFKDEGFEVMYVPQSQKGDFDGYLDCYEWGANNSNVDWIGMSILALPNAMPHIHPAYVRAVVTQRLLDEGVFNKNKKHHYLGLINASLELPTLLRMGVLDRCDSSNPVWAAANGYGYDPGSDSYLRPTKKLLPEVDFNWRELHGPSWVNDKAVTYEQQFLNTANRNLDVIQSIFDDPTSHR